MRLPRLFQSALLRCRYEGLSPSGQSVKGVRNDSGEFTAMTTYCHSDNRRQAKIGNKQKINEFSYSLCFHFKNFSKKLKNFRKNS